MRWDTGFFILSLNSFLVSGKPFVRNLNRLRKNFISFTPRNFEKTSSSYKFSKRVAHRAMSVTLLSTNLSNRNAVPAASFYTFSQIPVFFSGLADSMSARAKSKYTPSQEKGVVIYKFLFKYRGLRLRNHFQNRGKIVQHNFYCKWFYIFLCLSLYWFLQGRAVFTLICLILFYIFLSLFFLLHFIQGATTQAQFMEESDKGTPSGAVTGIVNPVIKSFKLYIRTTTSWCSQESIKSRQASIRQPANTSSFSANESVNKSNKRKEDIHSPDKIDAKGKKKSKKRIPILFSPLFELLLGVH